MDSITHKKERPTASQQKLYELSDWQSTLVSESYANKQYSECCSGYVRTISGPFDHIAFKKAISGSIAFNSFLQSQYIISQKGRTKEFLRFINHDLKIPCPLVDFSAIRSTNEKANEFIKPFILKPYDILNDKLVRFCILRFSDGEHLLVVGAHRSILENTSLETLCGQLIESYYLQQ